MVAGYPWFGAWSRDTMISYEGLFLAAGRAEEGRALLTAELHKPQYFSTPRARFEADPVIAQSTNQPDASYVCRIQFTF